MSRNEYPRPDFVRSDWISLNGSWSFSFDDDNLGLIEKWFENPNFAMKIQVPFAFQAPLSGIGDSSFHDYLWYHRKFDLPETMSRQTIMLNFQAVDYECRVYVNGQFVGQHIGGTSPFGFDITEVVRFDYSNDLVVYVYDPSTDIFLPRGKQYWKPQSESIWYTRTSGIYQSVWIEAVPHHHIKHIKLTPHYDEGLLELEAFVSMKGRRFEAIISNGETVLTRQSTQVTKTTTRMVFKVLSTLEDFETKSWSPENPFLFDVQLTYGQDCVKTYVGMRKIATKDGKVMLNNKPYYLKMVLDQGYWPQGLLTAPSIQHLRQDIIDAKQMGFNGARKHQKVEDTYFAYFADKIGFLIWGEMASSVNFSELSAWRDLNEWQQVLPRDYNHPSIIAWVPLNESWGVPEIGTDIRQQRHSLDLYEYIKKNDPTRLVISNDGWELTITDICAIHNYNHGKKDDVATQRKFRDSIATKSALLASKPSGRPIYANGYVHRGEPIVLTEFGGISYTVKDDGWGYTSVSNGHDLLDEYRRLINDIKSSEALAGFCYTQLTDVEQEINGLLTYDRKFKVPAAAIKEINDLIET